MYLALKHSHMLLAVLTFVVSIAYVVMAWKLSPMGKSTLVYVFARIFGGMAALTGLAITFVGPWQQLLFPYIGLILYVLHGLCLGFAKRCVKPEQLNGRRSLLTVQLLLLVILTGLMSTKSF